MTQPTIRRWIAAIGSFAVYAIPLVGPHAAWFLGESLLQGFGSNTQIAWMATNVAVAVAAQVLAGVVLYWSLGEGWVRKMAWLGVIPLTAALNVAYMSAIPALTLRRKGIRGPNTVLCEAPNCGRFERRSHKPRQVRVRGGRPCHPTGVTRCYEFPTAR
jgi:hypothetical protein